MLNREEVVKLANGGHISLTRIQRRYRKPLSSAEPQTLIQTNNCLNATLVGQTRPRRDGRFVGGPSNVVKVLKGWTSIDDSSWSLPAPFLHFITNVHRNDISDSDNMTSGREGPSEIAVPLGEHMATGVVRVRRANGACTGC
jgi:hypothetical protein